MHLVCSTHYVPNPEIVNVQPNKHFSIQIQFDSNKDAAAVEAEPEEMSKTLRGFLSALESPYMMYRFKDHNGNLTSPLTDELADAVFSTTKSDEIQNILHSVNQKLSDSNKEHINMPKRISLILDEESYNKAMKDAEAHKEKMKSDFLNDMFLDSGLEDNPHNRLIAEKSWTVACNVDYYGEYMSVNFYNAVERWFRELKPLAYKK